MQRNLLESVEELTDNDQTYPWLLMQIRLVEGEIKVVLLGDSVFDDVGAL